MSSALRRLGRRIVPVFALLLLATSARANELWVSPTYQSDVGGLGIGSNSVWPATVVGAVRIAWAIPNDLQTFQSAKVVLIPDSPGGAANVNVLICSAQHADVATASCAGPFTQAYTGVATHVTEVDISGIVAPRIGTAGATYLTAIVYTTPTTLTDHIVGLRFGYAPKTPTGVATLAANTFSGTQTATAFVGSGAGLTNLPFPAGAATLGTNVFAGTQTAPAFVGDGSALTNLPIPSGAATLVANTFNGTQFVHSGNLQIDPSNGTTTGNIMQSGFRLFHNERLTNVFLGTSAGELVNSPGQAADDNTGIGYFALSSHTSGSGNTAVGKDALTANATGAANTSIGRRSLLSNIDGALNTAVGSNALVANTGGDNNVAVGASAGSAATTGSFNIYLGASVSGVAGESNTMYLGRVGTQTKTLIAGVRGITTANGNAIPVLIDSAGQLGTISSSVRFKQDIHDMADASHRVFDLRPVTFRYTQAYADGSKPVQFGLVAEEAAAVFPELAVRGADGVVETVHYETLSVLLLNEVQKQQRELEQLKEQMSELMKRSREREQ